MKQDEIINKAISYIFVSTVRGLYMKLRNQTDFRRWLEHTNNQLAEGSFFHFS